jgi:hypothetical protein
MLPMLLAAAPLHAEGSFMETYKDWVAADPAVKRGYVQGIWDHETTFIAGSEDWQKAQNQGIRNCRSRPDITAEALVAGVDEIYAGNREIRIHPVAFVVSGVIQSMCLDDINVERDRIGLDPWEKWRGF